MDVSATCATSASSDDNSLTMEARIVGYLAHLDILRRRAQSPPEDPAERASWAVRLKEDCMKFVPKLREAAADALEDAAWLDVPGSMDLYMQVNAALESCATCHKLADAALATWSVEQALELTMEHCLETCARRAKILDEGIANSIPEAVKDLNAGRISCPEGCCIVRTSDPVVHFVLYRSDKESEILDLVNQEANQTASLARSASVPSLGSYGWNLMKKVSAKVKQFSNNRKQKEGYIYLGTLAYSLMGGSDSGVEWARKQREKQEQVLETIPQYSSEFTDQDCEKNQSFQPGVRNRRVSM